MAISNELANLINKEGPLEQKAQLGTLLQALQTGQVTGTNGATTGFDAKSIPAGALRFKTVTGTTSGTAGTQVAIAHGLTVTPSLYFVQVGNAYISAAADATNVYVASTAVSQNVTVGILY